VPDEQSYCLIWPPVPWPQPSMHLPLFALMSLNRPELSLKMLNHCTFWLLQPADIIYIPNPRAVVPNPQTYSLHVCLLPVADIICNPNPSDVCVKIGKHSPACWFAAGRRLFLQFQPQGCLCQNRQTLSRLFLCCRSQTPSEIPTQLTLCKHSLACLYAAGRRLLLKS
jgi:hypothetical protein